jgi:hypothetical protein
MRSFVSLLTLLLLASLASAATVTGTLTDISLEPLNTKLVFTPTNEVLVTDAGLSAGPARVIDTTNGLFSLALDAGDYTVSLPLVPLRRPFRISVMPTNGTLNLTSLLAAPLTYHYTNPPAGPPTDLTPTAATVGGAGDWFWLGSAGGNRFGAGPAFSAEFITLAQSGDGVSWTQLVNGPVYFEPNYYTNLYGPIAREGAVQYAEGRFWMAYNFDPYDAGHFAQGLGLARSSDLTNWSRVAVLYPFGVTNPAGRMFAATWFTDDDGSNYLVAAYAAGPVTAPKECFVLRRLDATFTNWSAPTLILSSNRFKWDGALLKTGPRYDLYYVNLEGGISRATNAGLATVFQPDYDLDTLSYGLEAPQIIPLAGAGLRLYGRLAPDMYYADSPNRGDTWPAEPTPLTGLGYWHGPGILRLAGPATNRVCSLGAAADSVRIVAPILQAGAVLAEDIVARNGLVANDGYFLNHLRSTNVSADLLSLGWTNPAPAVPGTVRAWVRIVVGGQEFKLPLYQ